MTITTARRRSSSREQSQVDPVERGLAGARVVEARNQLGQRGLAGARRADQGKTATAEQAQEAHAFIRRTLGEISDEATADKIRIQYGGSVKPDNARTLMAQPDIDGALVGGASLDPRSFAQIVQGACAN